MKSILGICDGEKQYADILCENLMKRNTFPLNICTFNDAESVYKAVRKGMVTVLLISEEMCEACKDIESEGLQIIILNEGKYNRQYDSSIWKYQSAENIKREILSIVSNNTDISNSVNGIASRKAKIIGLISPFDSVMLGNASVSLAKLISGEKKVLFLSFKSMSVTRNTLDVSDDKDITDLIYYLRNWKDKFVYYFEGMVCSLGKMDYIPPIYSFLDTFSILKEDWLNLIEAVVNLCGYEYVIIELGSEVNGLQDIMRKCELTILVSPKKDKDAKIIKEMKDALINMEYEDVADKITVLGVEEDTYSSSCSKDMCDRLGDLVENLLG